MTEPQWQACADPRPMLEILRDKVSERPLRLFAAACCRRVWNLLTERSRNAVEIAEAYADGSLSEMHLHPFSPIAEYSDHHAPLDDAAFLTSLFRFDRPSVLFRYGIVPISRWEQAAEQATVERVCSSGLRFPVEAALAVAGRIAAGIAGECERQAGIVRCLFCTPFHRPTLAPAWRSPNVTALAQAVYDDRAFGRLPILADALEDAGCDNRDILDHCRLPGEHARGCWVVDLVLGRE